MPPSLPCANGFGKAQVCGARNDFPTTLLQTANMKMEKNAGPNFLGAWRRFREMSQEELAERIGTTKAVISLLESGDRPLSAKWLRKIAPVLDATPGHLLDHDPSTLPADVLDIWGAIEERDRPRALRALEVFKTGTAD